MTRKPDVMVGTEEEVETLYIDTTDGRQALSVPKSVKDTFELGEKINDLNRAIKELEDAKFAVISAAHNIEQLKNDIKITYKIELPKEYGRVDKIVEYTD